MAGLGGIVALLVKNAVKSAVKFELAIDPIIAKFENQCPPKAVLDQTIKQKNQLTNALTQIETSLSSLDKTGSTIDGIVTGVKIGVSILKALPIPSSVPPGVGIPLNVINGFSDTLDTLGVLLKEFGGVTSQISPSLQIITKTLATVNSKLAILDGLLVGCLEAETEGMTDLEKEEFFQSLGIDLSSLDTTGGSNNPGNNDDGGGNPNGGNGGGNTDVNETLESRLSPNSNNPIVYKGFTIILDNDAGNQFSFPSRRAIGTNDGGVRIVTPFSFSSSTEVLINTIKFEIDQLGSLELSRLARESKIESLTIIETKAEADKYYESYVKYIEDDIASLAITFGNFTNLNSLYNRAVEGYRAVLALNSTDEYAKLQLIKLKKLQDDAKSRYKPATLEFLGGAPTDMVFSPTLPTLPTLPDLEDSPNTQISPSYEPFGGPGTVSGEVKIINENNNNKYYKWSNYPTQEWKVTTPSFTPIGRKGNTDGELTTLRSKENTSEFLTSFKWDQTLYVWKFVSQTGPL